MSSVRTPDILWDGSNLGVIPPEHIISWFKDNVYNYVHFTWKDVNIYARVTKTLSSAPIIIDELKPIFHLPKIGTHRMIYMGQMYTLFRVRLSPRGNVKQELTLDQLSPVGHPDSFIAQVKEAFCYRELIGVSKSIEKSIQVRVVGNKYYPLSYYEPNIVPACYGRVTPYNVLDNWFLGEDISIIARGLLGVIEPDTIPSRIHRLRGDLEKAIERIDRNWIWCVDSICLRVLQRIC